ncbi:translin [Canna indica]|uniref:Translin n=1 Tax=Canna indica TaxID=4628 RepID=A0AAQ3KML8_9LILI|nr:translin [Canna indica]
MRGALRAAIPIFSFSSAAAASLLSPSPSLLLRRSPRLPFCRFFSIPPPMANPLPPAPTASATLNASSSSMQKQFESFRVQLEESGKIRERIRAVVMEMETAVRLMHSSLLLVHHTLPNAEVLEKARVQIEVLKRLFGRLAEILRECPGQYFRCSHTVLQVIWYLSCFLFGCLKEGFTFDDRYHGDWRSETQTAVSLVAFLHWLETGNLLVHAEAEKTLGLDNSDFGLDIEDYLIGLCFMSNELPRYVVNQVTAGDYDCPRKVLKFLTDLHAAFRMLNLRNDFLRKKFDGMKYDLRRVEEVYYDVKIRGLGSGESIQEQTTET